MKKIVTVLLIAMLCCLTAFVCFGCGNDSEEDTAQSRVIKAADVDINVAAERSEMVAYTKTNDIWMYPKSYEGQTICIKGVYSVGKLSGDGDAEHRFVGVYDGCCVWSYLTVDWDGNVPPTGKTMTVIGTIHQRTTENGKSYAEIEASSVIF